MQSELLNLFAVPLYRGSLNRQLTDKELACIREQVSDSNVAISNYASRNKRVLESPALADLKQSLQGHVDEYFKKVFDTSNDVQLRITQSWVSMTRQGEAHHEHTHPNSVASGVFYINVGKQDGINFYRNEDNIWHELVRNKENYYNAYRYFIKTEIGDVLIFPSNIRHGVSKLQENVERLSLAFNTFFSGELGREDFSNQLRIRLE